MNENQRLVEETDDYVVYERDIKADEFTSNEETSNPEFRMWPGYSIKNIRRGKQWTNKNIVVSSDDIISGSSFTYKLSHMDSTTVEGVLSISAAEFNNKIGLKKAASISISKPYKASCPTTLNGKKIKSCVVNYYPRYQNYNFDEFLFRIQSGKGTAKVLVGFTQEINYSYDK